MCRPNSYEAYCVDDFLDCKYHDNSCTVNLPIRCGSTCVASPEDCVSDDCGDFEDKCPTGNCLTKYDIACLNIQGCNPNSPFYCEGSNSCSTLPYSFLSELEPKSCPTLKDHY